MRSLPFAPWFAGDLDAVAEPPVAAVEFEDEMVDGPAARTARDALGRAR